MYFILFYRFSKLVMRIYCSMANIEVQASTRFVEELRFLTVPFIPAVTPSSSSHPIKRHSSMLLRATEQKQTVLEILSLLQTKETADQQAERAGPVAGLDTQPTASPKCAMARVSMTKGNMCG